MNHAAILVLLAACMALGACGQGESRTESRGEVRRADETVFREQVRALERARTVEEQAEERKRELDERIRRESE